MDTAKYGLKVSVIAAISFILVLLGRVEAILLVIAYAIYLVKDEWLIKQTISAFVLYLSYALFELVIRRFFGLFVDIFTRLKVYKAVQVFSKTGSLFQYLLEIALIILVVISIINVLKRKDAKNPILNLLLNRKESKVFNKRAYKAEKENYQQPEYPPQDYNQPEDNNTWQCSCGTENSGEFCMNCGNKKE